jgi:hypothetical protein
MPTIDQIKKSEKVLFTIIDPSNGSSRGFLNPFQNFTSGLLTKCSSGDGIPPIPLMMLSCNHVVFAPVHTRA